MIDWLIVLLALTIIAVLFGTFAFMAWKINMPDPLTVDSTGKKDENHQINDSGNKWGKKDKYGNGQPKRNRKDSKKSKRDSRVEDEERHSSVTFKAPSTQTSEETDNEQEESEQESSTPPPPAPVAEVTATARKRQKNKARQTTPPPPSSSTRASGHIEGILLNRDEKSPTTTRAQPISHPRQATAIPKDEVELAKQHAQVQPKSTPGSNKQTLPGTAASARKPVSSSTIANQATQRPQHQEQPFTTVVNNRHKAGTPPIQQQQQSKPITITPSAAPLPVAPVQQQPPIQVQHEQLTQRQPPRQQKEVQIQLNGFNTNSSSVKQSPAAATLPIKISDLIKALPTSQAVVGELMLALDAYPLSTDELNIVMHKIANKQSVIKQDWTKLQHGQKVDPQVHIGQVMDESARACEEDMKTNTMKRIQELTDDLNNEKRRIHDLLKENNDKNVNIQRLHAQLDAVHHQQPSTQFSAQQQNQFQVSQLQLQRLTEDNIQLTQRLAQQQQHFQQQQLSSLNSVNTNDSANMQVRVLSEQMRKLAVDNANFEKNTKASESLVKQAKKEKDDILRSNQQLTQKVHDLQNQFQQNEDKLVKELNETRLSHNNQLNEHKRHIEQLQIENERLRREEIVHVEPTTTAPNPTLNNEQCEQLENEIQQLKQTIDAHQQRFEQQDKDYAQVKLQLTKENEQYKQTFAELQTQSQSQQNEFRQEIERLKQENISGEHQHNESLINDLAAKNAQIDALRAEIEEVKEKNDSNMEQVDQRLAQQQDEYKKLLVEMLSQDVRQQFSDNHDNFNQWFSSYRQTFESNIESNKRTLQEECVTLKHENDRLHKNMNDIESQLKEIEQTVQNKEEILLADLKCKDATLEVVRGENDQLNEEIQRLRDEIDRLRLDHETATNDIRTLKLQLDERSYLTNQSPPIVVDESFEFVSQVSATNNDARADELTELIRSSKEALENQDSIVQQLDKHIDDMQRSGTGEMSTFNVDEPTASLDQQQSES